MNESLAKIIDMRVEKTMKALEKNNMQPYYVKSRKELLDLISELIKNDEIITSGGSLTLAELGVIDFLNENYKGIFHDRKSCIDDNAIQNYFRLSFSADSFLSSTNAVTENGELYNVDGTGNRVSAMVFGPKQVIVVTGTNKIVSDLKAAEERVKKISAPANAIRLDMKTGCYSCGECVNCHNENRICCSYVTLAQQRIKNRIKVIFINEDVGL